MEAPQLTGGLEARKSHDAVSVAQVALHGCQFRLLSSPISVRTLGLPAPHRAPREARPPPPVGAFAAIAAHLLSWPQMHPFQGTQIRFNPGEFDMQVIRYEPWSLVDQIMTRLINDRAQHPGEETTAA